MKITDAQLKQIYAHAKEIYPAECCGFLLGSFDESGLVRLIRRATNQNTERNDRFIISAEEFGEVQLAADEIGLDIIGIYHSHPDWPAIPSQTDMDNAWDEVYYLITSVHEGMPFNTQIWRLADSGPRRFEWVALEIVDEQAV
ncbi:MAG: Mov34/MPN/PAD-1 family protein [Chloroflexota bacterium]|nr:MAG: Mov34/MPN/PAD-1 family protein [Chloroflexota bacterium]